MKKLIAALLLPIMLLLLISCSDGDENSVDIGNFTSRTAAFYGNMDKSCFYFKMSFTAYGETYDFTQATDGYSVATIEDHENDSYDKYHVFTGNAVHKLNFGNKTYDTVITQEGQGFLFGGYEYTMFASPTQTSVEQFEGKSYYCETFSTVDQAGGTVTGKNRYFYDGTTLKAIEIIDGKQTVMVMRFIEYKNEIPQTVYLKAPEGFKANTLEYEHSGGINVSEVWGDLLP